MLTRVLPCASLLLAAVLTAPLYAQQPTPPSNPAPAAPSSPPLSLGIERPLIVTAGEGAVSFTLSNRTSAPIPLALVPGPVTDLTTGAVLSKARITLSPLTAPAASAASPSTEADPAAAGLPKQIDANETLDFQVRATGISVASAGFDLFNRNTPLGRLTLVSTDAPFNISLDGENSPEKALDYTLGEPVAIALKNSDPEPYPLHWDLRLDGGSRCSGDANIPASGNARLTFTPGCACASTQPGSPCPTSKQPPHSGFSTVNLLHPSAKQATLVVTLLGPAGIAPGLLPSRSLPLSLRMRRVSAATSTFLSYGYAALFLFLGGFLSFLASSVLPAMQRKIDLRNELRQLRVRTTTVSVLVDSYLRVLLRLERSRIADTIGSASSWIPASADQVAQAAAAIATLTRRLSGAERLDDLRRKHDLVSATAPPSVTDGIDANLQAAADQLHSFALTDSDLAAAKMYLDRAQATLDMLNDTEALAKQIAANVALLNVRLAKFPPNYYTDLKAALPGVWMIADPNRGFDDPKNVTRSMLFAIDHGAAAIQLALDFAMVRASIPGKHRLQPSPAVVAATATAPASGPATPALAPGVPRTEEPENDGSASHNASTEQSNLKQTAAPPAPLASGSPQSSPTPSSQDAATPEAPPASSNAPSSTASPQTAPPPHAAPLVPPFTADDCEDLGRRPGERLLKRQRQLIELLGSLSWRALRDATLLVQEMREDVYEEDILEEIQTPGQAEITFDTQRTRPFAPVFFNITFRNSRYNDAAAVQRLLCHWSFPDRLDEPSWKVCHYFTGDEKTEGTPPEPIPRKTPAPSTTSASTAALAATQTADQAATQTAAVPDPPATQPDPPSEQAKGEAKPSTPKQPVGKRLWYWPFAHSSPKAVERDFTIYATVRGQLLQESEEIPMPPLTRVIHLEPLASEDRARYAAEGLRFAIAFGVALAGLLSGALDQLDKLDFLPATIAIITLGFTANSVKNLLTQSAAPAQLSGKGPS